MVLRCLCAIAGTGHDQCAPEPRELLSEGAAVHAMHNRTASGDGNVGSAKPLDFRILTEPVAMRPNKGAYGVPYDLVDTSHGSAMSEMLQQLQEADSALSAMNIMNHSIKSEE